MDARSEGIYSTAWGEGAGRDIGYSKRPLNAAGGQGLTSYHLAVRRNKPYPNPRLLPVRWHS